MFTVRTTGVKHRREAQIIRSRDFLSDHLVDGCCFRILAIIDHRARECLALMAATSCEVRARK